jgi:type IV secretion system protein VirB5
MTRRSTLLTASGCAVALLAAMPAAGLGIEIVKDPWTLAQATETVRKLGEQYRNMVEQLATAKAQAKALTSRSGFGDLMNGAREQSARRILPDAWADATDVDAQGDSAAMTEARELYRPATATEIDPRDPSSDAAKRYRKDVGTALAVYTGSQTMLDRVADRQRTYEGLMGRIEAAPDAKAAADLSNRLEAENGLTQNELVRATAMQANVVALQELRLASAKAASARASLRRRVNLSGGTYAAAQ